MIHTDYSIPSAREIVGRKELDEIINQFGSLISILTNKPISCVSLFVLITSNEDLKDVILDISDVSWYSLVEHLAFRYPLLNKSKKIKSDESQIPQFQF